MFINIGINVRIAHQTCCISLGSVCSMFTCTMAPFHVVLTFVFASSLVPHHKTAGDLAVSTCDFQIADLGLLPLVRHAVLIINIVKSRVSKGFDPALYKLTLLSVFTCFYVALQSHATYSSYCWTCGFQEPCNGACKNFPRIAVSRAVSLSTFDPHYIFCLRCLHFFRH